MYTEVDVNIRKILADDDHCDALDKLSGDRWTVYFARIPVRDNIAPPETIEEKFAINAKIRRLQEKLDTLPQEEQLDVLIAIHELLRARLDRYPLSDEQIAKIRKNREEARHTQQQQQQQQQQVQWDELNPTEKMLATLDLNRIHDLPCLLLIVPIDDENAYTQLIRLSDESPTEAYASLRSALAYVSQVFGDISEENLKNPEGVQSALSFALQNRRHGQYVKLALRLLTFAKKLLPPSH